MIIEEKRYTEKDLENACIFFCDVILQSPSIFHDKDGKDTKDLRQVWNEGMHVSTLAEIHKKARKRLEEEIEKLKK